MSDEDRGLETIRGSESSGGILPFTRHELLVQDVNTGLGVIEKILCCSDAEFADRSFLLEAMIKFGMPEHPSPIFAPWADAMKPSGFGALQIPSEYVDFLMALAKLGIETAAEIGSFRGGGSYFMAAVLQRANRNFVLSMIDLEDNLVAFDVFSDRLNLRKCMPASSDNFAGEAFDFVFVDGDHSRDGVMRDFDNLGTYARKAVAFHDIHGHEFDQLDGGTVGAWGEVKASLWRSHAIFEFAHSVERSMGIGLAVRIEQ